MLSTLKRRQARRLSASTFRSGSIKTTLSGAVAVWCAAPCGGEIAGSRRHTMWRGDARPSAPRVDHGGRAPTGSQRDGSDVGAWRGADDPRSEDGRHQPNNGRGKRPAEGTDARVWDAPAHAHNRAEPAHHREDPRGSPGATHDASPGHRSVATRVTKSTGQTAVTSHCGVYR